MRRAPPLEDSDRRTRQVLIVRRERYGGLERVVGLIVALEVMQTERLEVQEIRVRAPSEALHE